MHDAQLRAAVSYHRLRPESFSAAKLQTKYERAKKVNKKVNIAKGCHPMQHKYSNFGEMCTVLRFKPNDTLKEPFSRCD